MNKLSTCRVMHFGRHINTGELVHTRTEHLLVDRDKEFLEAVKNFALKSEEHRAAVLEAIGCGSPR